MKAFEFEQLEKIQGGKISQRQCAIAGVVIGGSFVAGLMVPSFWTVTLAMATMNADCF